jgi:internalin A
VWRPGETSDILGYYFAGQREGISQLNEAKLPVVGQPEVGKTRLVGWLVDGRDPGDKGWTRGVKIAHWAVDSAEAGGEPIRVNVWDFGGQEIMQATHQFFMTEGSLYLLVLDARNNEEQSLVRHWLEKIRSFGGGSPVIVVLNKQDVGSLAPNETRLKNDYEVILRDSFFKGRNSPPAMLRFAILVGPFVGMGRACGVPA